MTRIFFIIFYLRLFTLTRTHTLTALLQGWLSSSGNRKQRKRHRDCCAFSDSALKLHVAAMELGAAFHKEQAEAGARAGPDIAAPVKGLEQLLLIAFRNANAAITNYAD